MTACLLSTFSELQYLAVLAPETKDVAVRENIHVDRSTSVYCHPFEISMYQYINDTFPSLKIGQQSHCRPIFSDKNIPKRDNNFLRSSLRRCLDR